MSGVDERAEPNVYGIQLGLKQVHHVRVKTVGGRYRPLQTLHIPAREKVLPLHLQEALLDP